MSNAPQRREVKRVTQDCFAMLVRGFIDSPKFRKYSDSTKALWTRELSFAARPDCLGPISIQEIRPSLVQAFLDGMEGLPGKQAASLSALRQLEKWAVVRDLLPRPITLGIETEQSDDDGHIPWTTNTSPLRWNTRGRIGPGRACWPPTPGSAAPTWSAWGRPTSKPKTGSKASASFRKRPAASIWIPITATLADAMGSWARTPGPFLRRPDNQPWTRHDADQAWTYERDTNPNLAQHRRPGAGAARPARPCLRVAGAGRLHHAADRGHGWHVGADGVALHTVLQPARKRHRSGASVGEDEAGTPRTNRKIVPKTRFVSY